ncbi:response regulator [Uliginosibacterium sp. sgz301328]|uniref:response regulator n=1 Tax=Uliginosibacterium sp. sgz301328 TaxID=3243764 RepID=UPI00359DCF9E
MIRIVIADDHPIILSGLVAVLSQEMGIEVCGQAGSVPGLFALIDRHRPDVIVTDYQMPQDQGADGADLLNALASRYPNVPVVVLTVLTNPLVYRLMRKLGARGVLVKSGDHRDVARAIRAVSEGKEFLGPDVADALRTNAEAGINYGSGLSPRETEVIRLFANGFTVNEIAAQLNRSKQTISHQKHSAMGKIGVHNDKELIEYAIRTGLA